MVKLKAPLLSLLARGGLGNISFLRRRNQNIAEKTPIPKDAKTSNQLAWRTMYQLCVDLWHTLSTAEKQTWESSARPHHMTGYAWYMSQCLRPNPGIYLPLAGGTMSGDIAMAGNKVSGLPAPVAAGDAVRKSYVNWTLDKLLLGAGAGLDPTEIDVAFHTCDIEVFNGVSPAPSAFTDLDLSAVVGSRSALVILRLYNPDAVPRKFYVRQNGVAFYGEGSFDAGVAPTATNWRYALGYTDAAGIVEWHYAAPGVAGLTIDVTAFLVEG